MANRLYRCPRCRTTEDLIKVSSEKYKTLQGFPRYWCIKCWNEYGNKEAALVVKFNQRLARLKEAMEEIAKRKPKGW